MAANHGNIALQIQHLESQRIQTLLIAYLAGLQNQDLGFSVAEVLSLFDRLRIPRPSNVSQSLSVLRQMKLVVQQNKRWYITPRGEQDARIHLSELDPTLLERASLLSPSALFAETPHLTIPPAFAPPRWQPGINRLLDRYPFEQNVFCMTRFPNGNSGLPDPVEQVIGVLREILQGHGLVLHLASDRQVDDELFGNVGAHMWACHYGIGLLEDRAGKDLNYNVVIELGSMLMTGRRCAMLKDNTAPNLPTDLAGQIYKSVDIGDLDQVAFEAHSWIANDLGLGRCDHCPKL